MEENEILNSYKELIKPIKKTPIKIVVSIINSLSGSEIWCDKIAQREITVRERKYELLGEFTLIDKHFDDKRNAYVYIYKPSLC
jgi:hypothetical protein